MPRASSVPARILEELEKNKKDIIWIRELARRINVNESLVRYHIKKNLPEIDTKSMGRNKILILR